MQSSRHCTLGHPEHNRTAAAKAGSGELGLSRDDLVRTHLDLVQSVAGSLRASPIGKGVEFEDLVADGAEGLVEAAARFDPGRGVPFDAFAKHRVRGAMVDGIRGKYWLGRHAYRRLRLGKEALSRAPANDTRPDFFATPSADECFIEFTDLGPVDADTRWNGRRMVQVPVTEDDTLAALVTAHRHRLPVRERRILELCYQEGKSLTEAARAMRAGVSWASRLHSRALEALRMFIVENAPELVRERARARRPALRESGETKMAVGAD